MHENKKWITIAVTLPEPEAWAMDQFLKRLTFEDYLRHAVDKEDAWLIVDAAKKMREALEGAGISRC